MSASGDGSHASVLVTRVGQLCGHMKQVAGQHEELLRRVSTSSSTPYSRWERVFPCRWVRLFRCLLSIAVTIVVVG